MHLIGMEKISTDELMHSHLFYIMSTMIGPMLCVYTCIHIKLFYMLGKQMESREYFYYGCWQWHSVNYQHLGQGRYLRAQGTCRLCDTTCGWGGAGEGSRVVP